MHTGLLDDVARGEDWIDVGSLVNESDDEVTLTDATIVLSVCHPDCPEKAILTASVSNGKITLPTETTFQWWFTEDDTAKLCPGTYDVFLYVKIAGIRSQIFSCSVPILEGGPSS